MPESLPGDGPATVGGIALPAGSRVSEFLWWTDEAPNDAVGLWSEFAARFGETGLWPLVVFGYAGDWDLYPDEDWEDLANEDVETLLRRRD
jgi:hypothetical protein